MVLKKENHLVGSEDGSEMGSRCVETREKGGTSEGTEDEKGSR